MMSAAAILVDGFRLGPNETGGKRGIYVEGPSQKDEGGVFHSVWLSCSMTSSASSLSKAFERIKQPQLPAFPADPCEPVDTGRLRISELQSLLRSATRRRDELQQQLDAGRNLLNDISLVLLKGPT
jgi:hypothetical protein